MMKKTLSTFLATSALLITHSVSAAVFDFSSATEVEQGFLTSVSEETYTIYLSSAPFGTNVHQDSSIAAGTTPYITTDGNGGLGVCPAGLSDCNNTGQDGLDKGESLILTFNKGTKIDSWTFNKAPGHQGAVDASGALDITIDGTAGYTTISALGVMGTEFIITNLTGEPRVYLAGLTAVPVPAAGILFGTALLGFLGYTRRKSKLDD